MSDPTAPVCSTEPIVKPTQPPATGFPAIPQAVDLPSALRAINAMAGIMRTITGQLGRSATSGGSGGGTNSKKPGKPPPPGRWVQKQITRKNVVIRDPTDPSISITVSRVQNLTMQDSLTGETWVYNGTDG